MQRCAWFLAVVFFALSPSKAGQLEAPSKGAKLDKQLTQRWKVGMTIRAAGPCAGIFGTAPIPTDWPEQQVRIVKEEVAPQAQLKYRTLDNGVRQLLVYIATLNAGETASVLVTVEVTKFSQLGPDDPSQLKIPEKLPRDIARFLAPSPMIESRHPKIVSLAKEVLKDKKEASAWEQVEAIYDWVRDHVEYKNGDLKGAVAALKDGTGDCEELTSLFVALCRANRIPARCVWIPEHCYPEFYLQDDSGAGYWIPCQAAGTRDFGGMPDFRPILQKGDNFKVPEIKEPQRYVAEFVKMNAIKIGTAKPKVDFVRQLLPAGE